MPGLIDYEQQFLTFGEFEQWIRETDPHADYHLKLATAAERVLQGENSITAEERRRLANELERWRYQIWNHYSGRPTERDRQLSQVLDLIARKVAGRPADECRAVREAVGVGVDGSSDDELRYSEGLNELTQWLRPEADTQTLFQQARELTKQHFRPCDPSCSAWRMKLFAPLYLSNYCVNYCLYCGFRYPHQLQRIHLTREQAIEQAEILWRRGIRHVLLVAGDFPQLTTVDYFVDIVSTLRQRGFRVGIEIAPQSTLGYERLVEAGVHCVTLYQETYDEQLYYRYHPRGTKRSFDWRLETHDRSGEAGIRCFGLGILLGLADPVEDLKRMIRHGRYLRHRFPDARLAFSLPRIREAPDGFEPPYKVDDELFVRLYCVLRLAFPKDDLVLSTREPVELRDRLARLCITRMSAGSSTAPGGYEDGCPSRGQEVEQREQFPVFDHRPPSEVAKWLQANGYELVWEF